VVGSGDFYENVTISRTVDIRGQGPLSTTVNGSASDHVFVVDGSSTPAISVTLESLGVMNGSSNEGGGIYSLDASLTISDSAVTMNFASAQGGGIFSTLSELNIINSDVTQNEASQWSGGGIYIDSGEVSITDSRIADNDAGYHGGGIYNQSGDVLLEGVSVMYNTTNVDGAGVFNHHTMIINNSSVTYNETPSFSGGGIRNEGTAYINNSTVSHNLATLDEAGIDNQNGVLRLSSSTVTNNSGGGIGSRSSDVRVQNSIVSGNSPDDCRGEISSDGYNVIGDTKNCTYQAGSGDLVGRSANLGVLEGEPGYHPLLLGVGINAGNPDGCRDHAGQLLDADQRGMPRAGRCDIGAYEYQGEFHQMALPLCLTNYCSDFYDDFSDPSSGWEAGEDKYVRFGYLNGEYQIVSKKSGYFYLFDSPSCERVNYIVEVDARWVGKTGNSYGIVFGISGNFDRYYLFEINTDYQMFRLLYHGEAGWDVIIAPENSGSVQSGNATNHLKVAREGNNIGLWINGVKERTVFDNRISGPTKAGIVSSPYSNRSTSDARFDNFSMITVSVDGDVAIDAV
jgi:hypothetical protein